MNNRVLEKVKGPQAAVKAVKIWAANFEDCNGAGRIKISESGLECWDNEGSGEFCNAVCININEAASCAEEIYEIRCLA